MGKRKNRNRQERYRWWHRIRAEWLAAFAALVAAGAAVLAVVPVHKPAAEFIVGAADEVRDTLRSPSSRRGDNLRERVPDRDYWASVDMLDQSLDVLSAGLENQDWHSSPQSIESAVQDAFALRARPVSIVARVLERHTTSETGDQNGVSLELRLVGRYGHAVEARAGLSADSNHQIAEGDIVVVTGLIVATGILRHPSERERRGIYLFAHRVEQRLSWTNKTTMCPIPWDNGDPAVDAFS